MADFSVVNSLFGRRKIFTSTPELNENNIVAELNLALTMHAKNCLEMEYLYWYRRGVQPVLGRKKEVKSFINNRIVENHADEIVSFKNGYFLTQPAFYISRSEDDATTEKVKRLNEYLYRSGKQQVDNKVVDWFHTVGKGALIIMPTDSADTPVVVHALDPRTSFVIYSFAPGNHPVAGVNMSIIDEQNVIFDVFTRDSVYRISGGVAGQMITNDPVITTAVSVESVEENRVGYIPIVEYYYNSVNMGAFEGVIPLLDALNDVMSNRIDGVEQFIQSLAVATNCQFEEGVTADEIRKAGMLVLKSIGENKADFKILAEQLNQSETQVLVDYMYQQVLTICGMPSTTKGGTSTSDTGAAVLARDGWYQADTHARNTEDLFKESNRYFDEIFISILNRKTDIDISLTDFELQFVRNETANVLSKAQAATTLLAAGFSPELAFGKSGISNDPVQDVAISRPYLNLRWGDPSATRIELVEETRSSSVAGAV